MNVTNDVIEWPVQDMPRHRSEAVRREVAARIRRDARRRRNASVGVLVTGGLLAVGVTSGVFGGTGERAEAAWSAVPRGLSIGLDDPMVGECRDGLRASGVATPADIDKLSISVAERRGASRAVLLATGNRQAVCISTPTSRFGGMTSSAVLAADESLVLAGNGGSSDPDGDVRYVYGKVSDKVASVHVLTTDDTVVDASVEGGEFLAWWPASAGGPEQVSAVDAEQDVLQVLAPE